MELRKLEPGSYRGSLEESLSVYEHSSGDVLAFYLDQYQFRRLALELGATLSREDILRGMAKTMTGTPAIRYETRSARHEYEMDGVHAIHGEGPSDE